jgi:hypothetical protein
VITRTTLPKHGLPSGAAVNPPCTDRGGIVEPMNREQRRHPEQLERLEREGADAAHADPPKSPEAELLADDRVPDDYSVRAKNTGHGKKTADKWNQ